MQSVLDLLGCLVTSICNLVNSGSGVESPIPTGEELEAESESERASSGRAADALSQGSTEEDLPWFRTVVGAEPDQFLLDDSRGLETVGGDSGERRVRLAYQRGIEAARIYRGELGYFITARTRAVATIYVVLRCEHLTDPFVTCSYRTYFQHVRTGPNRSFWRDSIPHSFGSELEAVAFCRGAGLSGLPQRLQ